MPWLIPESAIAACTGPLNPMAEFLDSSGHSVKGRKIRLSLASLWIRRLTKSAKDKKGPLNFDEMKISAFLNDFKHRCLNPQFFAAQIQIPVQNIYLGFEYEV